MVYDGVDASSGRPQQFLGETGAQSTIIPALDALLGITHADDPLRRYLAEMRCYMPREHREFLRWLEGRPPLRQHVESAPAAVRALFNDCVEAVHQFRAKHLEYAAQYIQKQAQVSAANPNETGTGGTPFMAYLKKHRDETSATAV
jgi:indoleamine 2,3-dioxygenase